MTQVSLKTFPWTSWLKTLTNDTGKKLHTHLYTHNTSNINIVNKTHEL